MGFFVGTKRAKVLFDYAATAENQISLKNGQIINIINYGGKGGWSKGVELATGKIFFVNNTFSLK